VPTPTVKPRPSPTHKPKLVCKKRGKKGHKKRVCRRR
jgi:hypothetical protein